MNIKKFIVIALLAVSSSVFGATTYSGPFKADGSNLPPGAVTQSYYLIPTLNKGFRSTTANLTGQLSGQRIVLTNGISVVTGNFSGDVVFDTNTLVVDSANNRVGIGTTIPVTSLSVNGVGSFGSGSVSMPSISAFGDLNTGIWFPAEDTVALSSGGAERIRVNSSGELGIGTSSPSRFVHISTNSTSIPLLVQATGTNTGRIAFADSGTSVTTAQAFGSDGNNLVWYTGSTEKIRLTSTGLLGIGTASPATLLHVNGNTTTVGASFGYTSTATAAGTTTLTSSSTFYQDFTGSTTQTCLLPVTSTLLQGWTFDIRNHSSGAVTVQSSGGNIIATLAANSYVRVICILTSGTGTASWSWVTGNIGG